MRPLEEILVAARDGVLRLCGKCGQMQTIIISVEREAVLVRCARCGTVARRVNRREVAPVAVAS